MRHRLEYFPVWLLAKIIGRLPRPLARAMCAAIGLLAYALYSRLRRVGMRNLEIAFPAMGRRERKKLLRRVYRNIGRQMAEFCLLPRYTKENISQVAVYDGFENFAAASDRGQGVIFLTAHFGGWEIGSFFHSLQGNRLNIVIRPLDNPYLNAMVDAYRTRYGNRTFPKQDFARGLLSAMKRGETVGILMDTNMTPPQGAFVDFFGVPACSATGVARVAAHTGAAVVPAFTIWDKDLGKYRIHFDPALKLVQTGDREADVIANTAGFNKVIEGYVTRYPEQWLWVHRRWKTRPVGEQPLY
ncbi:MAG TPA: lysophospholipid acyltransferase family protein [Candidatus Saccharimonadales bacterium]|jgi:KDO2-lipid IV(A) lauroyltransferase|nr:lysophospholipid acyltransferase family protein [Candidatus Saccharimonadales bacterium]